MSLRDKIESLALDFADGVLAAIRECSLEDLAGGETHAAARDRAPKETAARAPRASSGRLARRSAEDIEKMADQIVVYVKGHPGVRSEQIRVDLGIDKKEWMRPLQYALDKLSLKKSGNKRATEYSVGGASTKAAPKKTAKKAAPKKAAKVKAKTAPKKAARKAKAKAAPKKSASRPKVKAKKPAKSKPNGMATSHPAPDSHDELADAEA